MKEIDKKILHKEELKEKLKTNLLKEKSRSRKLEVCEIYKPKPKSSTRLRRSSSISQTRLGKKPEGKCKISEKNSVETLTKRRSSSSIRQTEVNSKHTNGEKKKLPELTNKQSKITSKSSSQTNFILANKLSVSKSAQSSDNRNRLPPLKVTEKTLSKDFMKVIYIFFNL